MSEDLEKVIGSIEKYSKTEDFKDFVENNVGNKRAKGTMSLTNEQKTKVETSKKVKEMEEGMKKIVKEQSEKKEKESLDEINVRLKQIEQMKQVDSKEIDYEKLAEALVENDKFKKIISGTLRGRYSKVFFVQLFKSMGRNIDEIAENLVNREFNSKFPVVDKDGYCRGKQTIRGLLYDRIQKYLGFDRNYTGKIDRIIKEIIADDILKEEIKPELSQFKTDMFSKMKAKMKEVIDNI